MEDLGNNVWYIPYTCYEHDHLRLSLPKFKQDHPDLIVTAIIPDIEFFPYGGERINGWIISCERIICH